MGWSICLLVVSVVTRTGFAKCSPKPISIEVAMITSLPLRHDTGISAISHIMPGRLLRGCLPEVTGIVLFVSGPRHAFVERDRPRDPEAGLRIVVVSNQSVSPATAGRVCEWSMGVYE